MGTFGWSPGGKTACVCSQKLQLLFKLIFEKGQNQVQHSIKLNYSLLISIEGPHNDGKTNDESDESVNMEEQTLAEGEQGTGCRKAGIQSN